MRITSGNIGMESERRYSSLTKQSISFTRSSIITTVPELVKSQGKGGLMPGWEGQTPADEKEKSSSKKKEGFENNLYQEMDGWAAMTDLNNRFSVIKTDKMDVSEQFKNLARIREQCLSFLIKLFEPHRKGISSKFKDAFGCYENTKLSALEQASLQPQLKITTLTASLSSYYEELETTTFNTTGTVKTADGRSIDFNLELYMSRSFTQYINVDSQMLSKSLSFCDPLVINLEGSVPQLSDQKFLFDIDCDGIMDEISKLMPGSGYLALDKNGNGSIDDGSELFGTSSGDGFKDLAAYDSDGNGFIDEGDDIWDKLLILTRDEFGNDLLYHVAEKGIGAICLKNTDTQYSLNSSEDNHTNGLIRKTGIFIYENGNIGTVQHLDLAR